MFLNGKRMAFLGLLLALTVLLVILSGVFEFNTLFLLAAASFAVGIAIRESGIRLGIGFYIASVLLGLILAPNKIYCFTYCGMGLYILVREVTWERLANASKVTYRTLILWIVKYVVFNLMYIPLVIFAPSLIYKGALSSGLIVAIIIVGQFGIFIFDYIYGYFQQKVWGKARSRFLS